MQNAFIVNLIARLILGTLFLMAGYWKVFVLTPAQHAQRFFIDGFADTWIPAWLLQVLGYTIPFLELAAGVLILLGFRTRDALVAVGFLLVVTTYGHTLQEPLYDIDGHTFTRLALVVLLLLLPKSDQEISVDNWLIKRHNSET